MNDSNIPLYVQVGQRDQYWYERLHMNLITIFGRDTTKINLVARLLAATSINTSLKSNVRLFRKALYELENGLPFSNYLPVMLEQLERVKHGRPLSGLKINAFANAIKGDHNAVVVDTWLLRAFEMDRRYIRKTGTPIERSGGASKKQFRMVEEYVREKAPTYNATPRQLSAMIWSGVRIHKGGDTETNYTYVLHQQFFNMFEDAN